MSKNYMLMTDKEVTKAISKHLNKLSHKNIRRALACMDGLYKSQRKEDKKLEREVVGL